MSRASQIAWWVAQAGAARDQVVQARQRRRQVRAMDDELTRGRGFALPIFDQRPAYEVIRGRTITGGADEERKRSLPEGKRGGGVGLGASGGGASAERIEGEFGGDGAVGRARQLAAGYQPAVIKVVSYARGVTRATATGHYVLREDVPLETYDGRVLADREDVSDEIRAWSQSFSKRAESQDVVAVRLSLQGVEDSAEGRATYERAIAAGFERHRHAWRLDAAQDGMLEARLVVAMAGAAKQRLRVRERQLEGEDRAARERRFDSVSDARMRERIVAATGLSGPAIALLPGGTSHGRDGVTWQLNRLAEKAPGIDDRGKVIANAADTRAAAREWGPSLRSQSSRDTMHLIISAKAGTDVEALRRAARNFFQDRFVDHKFMFGIHTDKEAAGHIHAHAVIAMKSENGQKLHPSRETFGEWRRAYADHAQAEGLQIVATSARERASSQSYGPKDKAIVAAADRPRPGREERDRAYASDPANQRLIANARQRMATARTNPMRLTRSAMGRRDLDAGAQAWGVVASEQPGNGFAKSMLDRLTMAQTVGGILGAIGKRAADLTKEKPAMAITAEKMAKDLRLMNETVERTADLLDGATKKQFQDASARYLETLANRLDLQRAAERGVMQMAEVEALVGGNADRLMARAEEIRVREEREARDAAKLADRAVEVERGREATSRLEPTSSRDLRAERAVVAGAERSADKEAREARAASEAARSLSQHPGEKLSPALAQTDAIARLRAEQDKVIREIEANKQRGVHAHKGQHLG